jgi:hypothetical protein
MNLNLPGTRHRSGNVAFDAVSCATVPISSEGGPDKWLKIKILSNHHCDFEPGGRGSSPSGRAKQLNKLSAISFLYLCYSVLFVGSKVFEPFPETRDFE